MEPGGGVPLAIRQAIRLSADERKHSMGGQQDGEDDSELRKRLEKLSTALGERRARDAHQAADGAESMGRSARAMSVGIRVLSEFVAAILVGVFLGWLIDRWFGTTPWGLVGFLFLGLAAGFWNVYRIAKTPDDGGAI